MVMDPVSTGLGAASLSIQLLDGVVEGYKFFLAAGNMPEKCYELRLKLQIEFQSVLDWSEVAGLLVYEYGQDLPEILKADKLILVAILTQIQTLMNDFASLNGRYKQLKPNVMEEKKTNGQATDLVAGFASISLKYEKNLKKRKHLRGTNHMLAMVKNAKDIAMDPKRLWWVAFDETVFKELLGKLNEYNAYLHGLLHGVNARKLEETTRNTYLEMIQVRSSIDDLKKLITAAMILGERNFEGSAVGAAQDRNNRMLESLAEFKSLSLANDASDDDKPPSYQEVVEQPSLTHSSIYYDKAAAVPESKVGRTRAAGKYYPGNGQEIYVWIEWKSYRADINFDDHGVVSRLPVEGNVTRVKELVTLLKSSGISEFRIPTCIGYFDDRSDKPDSDNPDRFGIVFQKPIQFPSAPGPESLAEAIATHPCPSLSLRVALAHKIATSVLYLHAVKWLHKALRPDSIIFFPNAKTHFVDFSEPFLSGFEYARPDRDGIRSTGASQDPLTELYVHPDYQSADAVGTYRKIFDIYSLGIILLEIAYWKSLQEIMDLPTLASELKPEMLKRIRERLLVEGSLELEGVKASGGERFFVAVKSCVEGLEAFGFEKGENDTGIVGAAMLQRGFTEKVVEVLGEIVL